MAQKDIIPFAKVSLGEDEECEVVECLRSGWLTCGPRVAKFEEDFARYVGCGDAVAVSSCTAALNLSLWALDIKEGDEVITPSFTWVSVPHIVALMGARPVFCDIDPDTLNIDLKSVEQLITPRTRAVVPVHFAGRPFDIDGLRSLVGGRPIYVVEDAAHAVGSMHGGRRIGSHSGLCAFSFHPNKNITTAEGGMITGADSAMLARIRRLRYHGITRDDRRGAAQGSPAYDAAEPGLKLIMSDLAASLGIHQLKKLDRFNARRNEIASLYVRGLKGMRDRLWVPQLLETEGCYHSWHLFNVCVEDRDGLRERVRGRMAEKGVATGFHYLPAHQLSSMREHSKGAGLPNTERIGRTIITLPMFPDLKDEEVDRVIDALTEAVSAG